jgi:hypothetical protein
MRHRLHLPLLGEQLPLLLLEALLIRTVHHVRKRLGRAVHGCRRVRGFVDRQALHGTPRLSAAQRTRAHCVRCCQAAQGEGGCNGGRGRRAVKRRL